MNPFPGYTCINVIKELLFFYNLFIKIEQILKFFKVKLNFENISFMTDFEKGLRKGLKNVFKGTKI